MKHVLLIVRGDILFLGKYTGGNGYGRIRLPQKSSTYCSYGPRVCLGSASSFVPSTSSR